jgi:hypothetical protein
MHYEEFRARALNDEVFLNNLRRLIREELSCGVGRASTNGTTRTGQVPPGYISTKQAAGLVGYTEQAVRVAVSRGYLEALKLGRYAYVPRTQWLHHVLHHGKVHQRDKAMALLGEPHESAPMATLLSASNL